MVVGLEVVNRMLPVGSEDIARISLETLADLQKRKKVKGAVYVSQTNASGLIDK